MHRSVRSRLLLLGVLSCPGPWLLAASGPGGQCLAPPDPGPQDEFGQVLAAGDFNGDRLQDLAVHAVQRVGDFDGASDSGTVTIYLRRPDGSLVFDRELSHDQSGASFGAALAAGRLAVVDEAAPTFDRDALVIGIPGQDVDGRNKAGRVDVVLRRDDGVWLRKRSYHQGSPGVPGALEADDAFGSALAVGDFDGDERADLAIGAPGEAIGALSQAGAVTVLYGESGVGVATTRTLLLHQDVADVADAAESGDRFGASLAAGDFLKDGIDDLAIGVPREDVLSIVTGMHVDAGLVHVFPGSASGLVPAAGAIATADMFPPLALGENQRFGEALAMGYFRKDNDGPLVGRIIPGDLAIGVPGFSSGVREQIGLVVIAYRSETQLFDPAQPRQTLLASQIGDPGQIFDRFGSTLAAGELVRRFGRVQTLAVGAPYRAVGVGDEAVPDAGAVYLVPADADDGLDPDLGSVLQAAIDEPCGPAAQGAQFGRGLAILDATEGSPARLAVGSPGLPMTAPDAGAQGAVELRGFGVFGDGFED